MTEFEFQFEAIGNYVIRTDEPDEPVEFTDEMLAALDPDRELRAAEDAAWAEVEALHF